MIRETERERENPGAASAKRHEKCERCRGNQGNTDCKVCGGMGYYEQERKSELPEWITPGDLEFLQLRNRVNAYGVEGMLRSLSFGGEIPEMDPDFWVCLDEFEGMCGELEAKRDRERMKAASKG